MRCGPRGLTAVKAVHAVAICRCRSVGERLGERADPTRVEQATKHLERGLHLSEGCGVAALVRMGLEHDPEVRPFDDGELVFEGGAADQGIGSHVECGQAVGDGRHGFRVSAHGGGKRAVSRPFRASPGKSAFGSRVSPPFTAVRNHSSSSAHHSTSTKLVSSTPTSLRLGLAIVPGISGRSGKARVLVRERAVPLAEWGAVAQRRFPPRGSRSLPFVR